MGNVEGDSAALLDAGRAADENQDAAKDALIARLAVTHDGFVVTHDTDDFQIIQKVMPNLKFVSAREFFNY
ncbi:MAG TPA: hypothetical protein VNI84_20840 [Pyrinomonadaceae bacterium]|nr:hypothetical protein [Pyrinomonadaceae bacterium]